MHGRIAGFFFVFLLLFGNTAWAQKPAARPSQTAMRSLAYNPTQEIVVEGTVLDYSAASATPPIGAHVVLQTANGPIDVHLGAASFLQAHNFSLAKGDTVRIVGVNSTTSGRSVFLARVVQKNGQSVTVRTPNGALLSSPRARVLGAKSPQQEGAR